MTSIYSFQFEKDAFQVKIHFIDETKNIDTTEALAQIGHFHRREWASAIIDYMIDSDTWLWEVPFKEHSLENPFGQRLLSENWNHATVALMKSDAHITLYIYRSYIFIQNFFFLRKSFYMCLTLVCRSLQENY